MKTLFTILLAVVITVGATAQSDILITPFRVVLEDGQRIEELSVANTGSDTARYTLSFVQYAMDPDGKLRQIEEPEEGMYFADRYLRIFPRSVTLAPNDAQIVRLQSRLPSDIAPGEYRSHLYFRSSGEQAAIGFEQENEEGLGIQLIPVYGITIPVIVRVGSAPVAVALENAQVNAADMPVIELEITRDGDYSTYGDLQVIHTALDGTETLVGLVRGVAVYTPLQSRKMKIPFNKVETPPADGSLKITYSAKKDGETIVFAETELSLE
jgi:hypothetical protein